MKKRKSEDCKIQMWKKVVYTGVIVLASIFWVMEHIVGGTKKSKRVAKISGMYPPGAEQIVQIYFKKNEDLYMRARKALGRYLQGSNPSLYLRTRGLFS